MRTLRRLPKKLYKVAEEAVKALVDAGATLSVIPRRIAEEL